MATIMHLPWGNGTAYLDASCAAALQVMTVAAANPMIKAFMASRPFEAQLWDGYIILQTWVELWR
jgi:hypothetical protein